jgi:hypothetical protein
VRNCDQQSSDEVENTGEEGLEARKDRVEVGVEAGQKARDHRRVQNAVEGRRDVLEKQERVSIQ